jgi:hypothetical protein
MRIFNITASEPTAYQHYIDTIENGFSIESKKKYLEAVDLDILNAVYGSRMLRAWGAKPGKDGENFWEKMSPGDIILIYRANNFEYIATVTHKIRNEKLAEDLWDRDKQGVTWEWIFFLDNLRELSLPLKDYIRILGYEPNFVPPGFRPISPDRISILSEKFGSIEEFINYLLDGKWLNESDAYSPEVVREIIGERITQQIGNIQLLEANLENFLVANIQKLELGLKVVGRQLETKEVGRLDILCEDSIGSLVVVELKRHKAGNSIMDQILHYMGWVKLNIAKTNQKVRGIIVVQLKDTALMYAIATHPDLQVKEFDLSFRDVK